jgi:predicted Zn finger-like uncharacterized protein
VNSRDPYSTANKEGDGARPPTQCPSCRSSDVMTTSKVVTSASYWRCGACGEVWNAERLKAASRYSGPSFRR